MTIAEAKNKLLTIYTRIQDVATKKRIEILIQDIGRLFVDTDELSDERIIMKINNADSRLDSEHIDYVWVMELNAAFVDMKRHLQCRKWVKAHGRKKIDGETAQWITNITQSLLGIASAVFTVLFAMGVIPNVFGTLGESKNSDALYYIFGIVVQQVVTFICAIVIGFINRRYKKKKYKNLEFSFEDALACKYADEPIKLWFLSPMAKKIRDSQIIFGNDNNQITIKMQTTQNGDITNNF